ncbi:MAG: LCP family protein [Oscillospiraceae bacterium]|nr:LCP family protein [Oscillospiraceae bacterium]
MAVRRKSNWYIYFIAFGIAFAFAVGVIFTFRDFLFPETQETTTGLTGTGELSDDFTPDASHSFTILTMLADTDGGIPELFSMVSYDAVDHAFVIIPLPNGISVNADERTLPNIYAAKGGEGAISAVANATGITCDGYICFDREAVIRLISAYGNVRYNIPKTVVVTDGAELDAFNAGEQIFSPEAVFRYIYLADFGEGEEYRFSIIGDIMSQLINQNISYSDSMMLDSYFKIISEDCKTDITEELYLSKKAALLNTITYGSEPAEFYIPYGEYSGDGSFTIAENSVTTINQKCGMDE